MQFDLKKYLVWLQFLVALANNAPVFIAAGWKFYETVKGVFPTLPADAEQGGLSITQAITTMPAIAKTTVKADDGQVLIADVLEAEEEVLALCLPEADGTLAVRDGSRLRELFAFFTMLRELLAGFGIGG